MNTAKQFLTIAEAMKNGNNTVNQNIKSKFVGQHVYSCVTSMAEYIMSKAWEDSKAPFCYEDIINIETPAENQYKYVVDLDERGEFNAHIEDTDGETVWTVETEEIQQLIEDGFITHVTDTHDICDHLIKIGVLSNGAKLIDKDSDFEMETQEIFEYWMVSSYLAEKLQERGQPILADENIWGRTCSGQAILLDYVITSICAEMQILQGQENSWE